MPSTPIASAMPQLSCSALGPRVHAQSPYCSLGSFFVLAYRKSSAGDCLLEQCLGRCHGPGNRVCVTGLPAPEDKMSNDDGFGTWLTIRHAALLPPVALGRSVRSSTPAPNGRSTRRTGCQAMAIALPCSTAHAGAFMKTVASAAITAPLK